MHYYALRGNKEAMNELMFNGGSILQENKRGQRPIDVMVTNQLDFQEHEGVSVTFTPRDG
jgi:hypothetical protein